MSLSIREKVLLLVLAAIAILFLGGKFLVAPAVQQLAKDSVDFVTTELKVTDANSKISLSKNIDQNLAKALDLAKSSAEPLLPSLDNPSLHVWILNTAKKSGLDLQSATFGNPTPCAAPSTETYSSSGSNSTANSSTLAAQSDSVDYLMKRYADIYLGKTEQQKNSNTVNSAIMTSATIRLAGNYSAVLAFLDQVRDANRCVIVSSFNCAKQGNGVICDLTLQFYASEKPDNSDTIFNWTLSKPAGKSGLM